ncbi:MAG: DNA-directed RNA polymerase subunit omega [Bacillota bacterium]|nr:DNA-directed RNA polymerase subunit omega [Bacillota bacterium]
MLVKPILSDLMENVDSKYILVSISAKRAREIMAKENVLYDNPVSMALREIAAGDVTWERRETLEENEDVN